MKKHPIDDIFRSKLTGLEKQPSASAWDRLDQGKKNDERRFSAWVWYAAASVAIAFMAGYSVWVNKSAEIRPQLAGQQNPVIIQQDSVKPQHAERPFGELADRRVEKSVEVNKKQITSGKMQRVPKKQTVPETIQLATTNVPVAVKPDSDIAMPEIVTAKEFEAMHVAIAETKSAKIENRTIVVKVEEPVVNEEKEKPSRFTRIFRQLKNAKQGETVDWDDVGFNPKALVARVDDRIRTGEEKVTEKYQNIKERTKL